MKTVFEALLVRFDAWLARSTLRAYEKLTRLRLEENARDREAVRDYFDHHYPSPTGRGWSRHE